MKKFAFVCLCVGLWSLKSLQVNAQYDAPHTSCVYHEENAEPREHELDIERVKLEVSFVPSEGKVEGKVSHSFKVLRQQADSVFFDGPGIELKTARLNGKDLKYRTTETGFWVYYPFNWNLRGEITFEYVAYPRKGIYFIGWNDAKNLSRKQIWTQGQGIDHRYWIPCYDDANDKVITETIVTFDAQYQVLSNGQKVEEKDNGNGTKTWHYRMPKPHSLYLLMLGIGKYKTKTLYANSGVPIHLWYYPEHEDRFEYIYKYSKQAMDFMEEHTGIPYPWGSYAQIPVQDFIYGAMENTTATIFGDFFCTDARDFLDRNYVNVNVHELTHQWFGDLITHRAPIHTWLHESFATFYPKIFAKKYYGEDYYQWQRRGEHNSALDAAKKDNFPVLSNKGGTARVYPKGSAVLDMMLYVFGEDQYRRVIQHYLKKHAYKNVETNDLYQAFQDTLGLSPKKFFEQWIERGGEPHYAVKHNVIQENGNSYTQVEVRQIHTLDAITRLFDMPIVLQAHYIDGTFDQVRVRVAQATETFRIPNPNRKTLAFVLFDPGSYVLKKLTFEKSFAELKAQALTAPNMIDRYDAVLALRNTDINQKRDLLFKIFEKEKFHAIKAEIVAQLSNDPHSDSYALLRRASNDPAHEVRQAVATHIKDIPLDLKVDFEKLLTDSSYNTVSIALEKLIQQFPKDKNKYLQITKNDYGIGNRVKIKWLELSAENKSSLKALVDYSSSSYEFRTRQAAFEALKRLNYLDDDLLNHLFDASTNPNTRLASIAEASIRHYLAQNQYRTKILNSAKNRNWTKAQKAIIDRIMG